MKACFAQFPPCNASGGGVALRFNFPFSDVFVCKLRKKLGTDIDANAYTKTVWARGYELRDPSEIERSAA